jgi:GTP 3',8-cyclase
MKPLTDSFGRRISYLRISITDRCNLRCVYCTPFSNTDRNDRAEILTFEEITRLSCVFVEMGVTKIRLTGGEPLVRNNIVALVSDIAAVDGLETLGMSDDERPPSRGEGDEGDREGG